MKKKIYIMPLTNMVRVNAERLLTANSQEVDIHDDETVDDPDDLLSREHDNRNRWDDDELEDDDYGKVSF